MAEHWETDIGPNDALVKSGNDVIAVIDDSLSDWQRHARLIAAAPDLLDALRALMALDVKGHALADRLQFSDSGRALLNQCRAAISKATP